MFGFRVSGWRGWKAIAAVVCLVLVVCLLGLRVSLGSWTALILTPDQQGQRLFGRGDYAAAAAVFVNPAWKAAASYRQGEFKQAAGLLAGSATAAGAYNEGNALAMQGKYEDAIPRFERALALRPGWEDAEVNLAVARQQAEKLKKEGGDMTGGEMGADDYTFTEGKPPNPEAGEETFEAEMVSDDAAARAMWLRKVQTQPADFLKSKFAYEQANRGTE